MKKLSNILVSVRIVEQVATTCEALPVAKMRKGYEKGKQISSGAKEMGT